MPSMISSSPRIGAASVLLSCILAPAAAIAQPVSNPAATQRLGGGAVSLTDENKTKADLPAWQLWLRGAGEFTFAADLDDDAGASGTQGEVSIARASTGLTFLGPIGDRARLNIDLTGEVSWYNFENGGALLPPASALPAGTVTDSLFDEVYEVGVAPILAFVIDEQWSWFLGGGVRASGESGADIGESLTYGGFGGARYAFSEDLALSFGLGVRTRLEDDPYVLPVLGLEWQINDKVRFATEGLGARVTAAIDDEWSVWISGAYESREFRLEEDGPLPDGVVNDSRFPIGVGVQWKPSANLVFEVAGGVVVWQEFEIDDSDGDEVAEVQTDPAAFIRAGVRIAF
ncbi:MAG: hypothetical protein H7Y88_07610 [Phycisphaerales bacterium]|nr:hypothetical protein [Phycisphaerales bacterium]